MSTSQDFYLKLNYNLKRVGMSASASSLLVPIYFVDAFTTNGNSAFTGNPAAVCFLDYDDDISDSTKQKIAAEINLSETAFVSHGWKKGEKLLTTQGSQLHRRTLRWFTPAREVELCGHATVAATRALVEAQLTDLYCNPEVKTITITYESKFCSKLGAALNKETDRITLNFPSNPSHELNKSEHSGWLNEMLVALLGNEVSVERACDIQYSPGAKILMVRLNENGLDSPADELRNVSPDFKKLLRIRDTGGSAVHDIIVTIRGPGNAGESVDGSDDTKPHFYSRCFCPWDGFDEDPVTGVAHTVLTPYWTQELTKILKGDGIVETLLGRQLSTRGGNVYCTLVGDRVNLSGTAKITIKGQLFV